jgi:hypothetical protein
LREVQKGSLGENVQPRPTQAYAATPSNRLARRVARYNPSTSAVTDDRDDLFDATLAAPYPRDVLGDSCAAVGTRPALSPGRYTSDKLALREMTRPA